jgi:hypothetical protein
MKKQHAVILVSSATFIGVLLIFGIIEMTKNKKASSPKPEPQRITLNSNLQEQRVNKIIDQYSKKMETLQRKIKTADPKDLNSEDRFAEEFRDASFKLAEQTINELRKTDPELADEMESKFQEMMQENNKH